MSRCRRYPIQPLWVSFLKSIWGGVGCCLSSCQIDKLLSVPLRFTCVKNLSIFTKMKLIFKSPNSICVTWLKLYFILFYFIVSTNLLKVTKTCHWNSPLPVGLATLKENEMGSFKTRVLLGHLLFSLWGWGGVLHLPFALSCSCANFFFQIQL